MYILVTFNIIYKLSLEQFNILCDKSVYIRGQKIKSGYCVDLPNIKEDIQPYLNFIFYNRKKDLISVKNIADKYMCDKETAVKCDMLVSDKSLIKQLEECDNIEKRKILSNFILNHIIKGYCNISIDNYLLLNNNSCEKTIKI